MFRLIRILNAGQNQPEPLRLPTVAGEVYSFGEALQIKDGKVTAARGNVAPAYICGEDLTASTGNTVTVYPVSPDMLFEVPVSAVTAADGSIAASLLVGTLCTVANDGMGVTDTLTGGVCRIFDLCGAKKQGDAVIVFIPA